MFISIFNLLWVEISSCSKLSFSSYDRAKCDMTLKSLMTSLLHLLQWKLSESPDSGTFITYMPSGSNALYARDIRSNLLYYKHVTLWMYETRYLQIWVLLFDHKTEFDRHKAASGSEPSYFFKKHTKQVVSSQFQKNYFYFVTCSVIYMQKVFSRKIAL